MDKNEEELNKEIERLLEECSENLEIKNTSKNEIGIEELEKMLKLELEKCEILDFKNLPKSYIEILCKLKENLNGGELYCDKVSITTDDILKLENVSEIKILFENVH